MMPARVRSTQARYGSWLIFAGHEIGPGGGQTTSDETLTQFADFVSDPQNGLYCDTVSHVARYVSDRRGGSES